MTGHLDIVLRNSVCSCCNFRLHAIAGVDIDDTSTVDEAYEYCPDDPSTKLVRDYSSWNKVLDPQSALIHSLWDYDNGKRKAWIIDYGDWVTIVTWVQEFIIPPSGDFRIESKIVSYQQVFCACGEHVEIKAPETTTDTSTDTAIIDTYFVYIFAGKVEE